MNRLFAITVAVTAAAFTGCQQRMASPPQYRPLMKTEFFPDGRSSRPLEQGTVHRGQILDDNPLSTGLTAEGRQLQTVRIFNDDGTPREFKTSAGIPNKTSNFTSEFPFKLTEADLQRGKERFHIYCMPCHGPTGNGRGKIVERGFLEPTSFHTSPVSREEKDFRDLQNKQNPQRIELGMSRGFSFYHDAADKPIRLPLREVPVGYIFEVISKGYGGMPDYASQIPLADRWRIAAYVRALQLSQNKLETERALGGKK